MLTEDFAHLVKTFGRPAKAVPLPDNVAESYRNKLPNSLIDFWLECGIGLWLEGKFQFCRPDQYHTIVDLVCGRDSDFRPEHSHLFGFTAFGQLFIWNEIHRRLRVSLPDLTAQADIIPSRPMKLEPERAIATGLFLLNRDAFDFYDDTPEAAPLFGRALGLLGELKLGECYGFVPALALGGAARLEHVTRQPALEHFALLAQLGRPRLMDYTGGRERFVRIIG